MATTSSAPPALHLLYTSAPVELLNENHRGAPASRIVWGGNRRSLGTFETEEEAGQRYSDHRRAPGSRGRERQRYRVGGLGGQTGVFLFLSNVYLRIIVMRLRSGPTRVIRNPSRRG